MISKKQMAAVEARRWLYILGARLRPHQGGARRGAQRHGPIQDGRGRASAPPTRWRFRSRRSRSATHRARGQRRRYRSPRRYVVCRNPDQARKDAATRAQLLAALESKLRNDGPKSVVANKGYKRYLKAEKGAFAIDLDKAREEERYDGMWVLRTNTELSAVEVALRYKQLWMVEQVFRTAKSLLDTRPIFHKTDATICGHVFCSFLALVLRDELFRRMDNAGVSAEWGDVPARFECAERDDHCLQWEELRGTRSHPVGVAGKVAQCVGVRLPNTVRQLDIEEAHTDPSL